VIASLARRIAFARGGVLLPFALLAQLALAQAPADDPAMTSRLKHLETELRCLVCQNQTLADSDASLASDLRREVRSLAMAGKSDDEIKTYLVNRYGDFVLYRPPVKTTTWLLWGGPFALLGCGALIWLAIVRRRRKTSAILPPGDGISDDAIAKARQMLYEEP